MRLEIKLVLKPERKVPASVYLIADHLDAALASGEDLLRLRHELVPPGPQAASEQHLALSAELRRRLRGNVSGALFYDLGNIELEYQDFLQFNDFRHGIGCGLRYLLPIGPLRLDAAWNPEMSTRSPWEAAGGSSSSTL